jgi:hypothetical protein
VTDSGLFSADAGKILLAVCTLKRFSEPAIRTSTRSHASGAIANFQLCRWISDIEVRSLVAGQVH